MREDGGGIIPCLFLLLFVCLPLLLVASPSTSSFSCHPDQRHALLRFIHSFNITDPRYYCQDASYPKVASWREDKDCCSWDGITCDSSTGDIIGLNLTCAGLHGPIHSGSPLFSLRRLRSLNLAGNDLLRSTVPPAIGVFTQLAYLDLSYSNISGILPTEISLLSKLISLDLSYNDGLEMQEHTMRMLIQNLTQIEELDLQEVNMSTVTPTSFMNLSSSLISLKLSDCSLRGKFLEFIFGLPNLQVFDISWNYDLIVTLPESNWSPSLDYLSFGYCSFTGAVPTSIGNLSRMTYLDLSENDFTGAVPNSIGNLSRLTYMDLSGNDFTGAVPNSIGNLSRLTYMDLMGNNFMGAIPNSIGNLSRLTQLDLSRNNFTGAVPNSIGNLSRLTYMDLSRDYFTGEIDLGIFSTLEDLQFLDLSRLNVSGEDANPEFSLPKLQELGMISCNLTKFPSFLSRSMELTSLQLWDNKIQEIPGWFWSIGIDTLEKLYLSDNIIRGSIPPSICRLTSLSIIDFATNHLTGVIPQCLGNLTDLQVLDLSSNSLSGPLPPSLANCTSLGLLYVDNNSISGAPPTWLSKSSISDINLSDNELEGPLPLPPYFTGIYSVSNNYFYGEIPSLICNATTLSVLDLSNNRLTGVLPDCMKSIIGGDLICLNIRANEFHGKIPNIFHEGSELKSLDLSRNQFEGPIPRSLSHCKNLEALDVGSNKIIDSFPNWLGGLPLKVISLRSNHFRGHVNIARSTHPFTMARIMDLSCNSFDGNLQDEFISEMFDVTRGESYNSGDQYLSSDGGISEYYSVMIDLKGIEMEMVKINVQFAMLDLSSNHFHGEIPKSIGLLKSLRGLNFSHNRFTGLIPPSVGNLTDLESLDLSSNHLMGELPKELVKLTSLGFLDLSWNNFTGPIPYGGHFDTFSNSSFQGNPGLCGIPLTRSCGQGNKEAKPPPVGNDDGKKDSGGWMVWEYVALGFGTGMGMGIWLGYMVLEMGRPLWLVRMVMSFVT